MKHWIDRYKVVNDWNRRQSRGNRKQLVFYEEIDQVLGCRDGMTLCHVAQVGSSSGGTSAEEEEASNEVEIVAEEDSKKENRTERKLSRKRAQEEENDQEYTRKCLSCLLRYGRTTQRNDCIYGKF